MRVKTQVCKNCGHEQKIEVYTREEAERDQRQLVQPSCGKCGSMNVELHD